MGLVYNGVGMGAGATGGWGDGTTAPKLMIVNSLTDSASPGSVTATGQSNSYTCNLRGALEASGNRVVVFAIGGTHTLTNHTPVQTWPDDGSITVANDNLTVLGQTAPGGGVTIRGVVSVGCNNTIWEQIRVRGTDNGVYNGGYAVFRFAGTPQFPWLTRGPHYIRRCSVSWGADEVMGVDGSHDVTVEDCLVGPCIKGARCFFTGTGGFSDAQRITLYRTIMWSGLERHPQLSNSIEIINCAVFCPGNYISTLIEPYQSPSTKLNLIKNYYDSVASSAAHFEPVYEVRGHTYSGVSSVYLQGNIDTLFRATDTGSEYLVYRDDGSGNTAVTRSSTKLNLGGASWIQPPEVAALTLYSQLFTDDGPGPNRRMKSDGTFEYYRDLVDGHLRTNCSQTPPWGPQGSGTPGDGSSISVQSNGIGWESLAAGTAPTDTNQDGIPDSYTLPAGKVWYGRREDNYPFLYGFVSDMERYWDDPPGEPFNITTGSPFTVQVGVPKALTGVSVYDEGEDIDDVEFDGGSNVIVRVGALGTVPAGVTLSVPE